MLDDADPRTRPVTFAVNGGPGASSAWLQLGALGPWRLALPGPPTPSSPSTPVPNAETWLDFTDLVFIDPPGTGYSQLTPSNEDLRRASVGRGDIPPLAEVVRRWPVKQGRAASPRLVVGESYGGFRGPSLVRALQTDEGWGSSGWSCSRRCWISPGSPRHRPDVAGGPPALDGRDGRRGRRARA